MFSYLLCSDHCNNNKTVLHNNRDTLTERGAHGFYQVKSNINGINYVVGAKKGRIAQFYIEKD